MRSTLKWTRRAGPPRADVISKLKEANLRLKGMDDSVRSAIQQCEDDIASSGCTTQFWSQFLIAEEKVEPSPDDLEDANHAKVDGEFRKFEGYQLGWSKVGKEWHLAYREVTRRYIKSNQQIEFDGYQDTVEKARALVDAPRLVKAASIEELDVFVEHLANSVDET